MMTDGASPNNFLAGTVVVLVVGWAATEPEALAVFASFSRIANAMTERAVCWTRDSRRVQAFVRRTLTAGMAHEADFHRDIAQRVGTFTAEWCRAPPSYDQSERCRAPVVPRTMPSRLHALQQLHDRHPEAWQMVRRSVVTMPATDAEIMRRVAARDFAWFHKHASDLLDVLSEDNVQHQLHSLSAELLWCCNLWKRHPDLYAYFVPLDVQLQAEQSITCDQRRAWSWRDYSFALHVLAPHISIRPDVLEQVAYRISLTTALGTHRCRHVALRWFPSNRKKTVHLDQGLRCSCWTPLHINTGATYRDTCDTVTIWRHEESLKTITHELIHGFAWDFDAFPGIDALVRSYFAVESSTQIAFYESYVETWATLVNVYAIAAQEEEGAGRSLPDPVRYETRIRDMIALERAFVGFQVAKILHRSGFKRWTEFFCAEDQRSTASSSSPKLCQRTPVFSYFVVRSAHLWDTAWFVRTFPHLEFRRNVTAAAWSWSAWWKHLLAVWSSPAYEEYIDQCLALHRTYDAAVAATTEDIVDAASTRFVYQTMRMTAHEIMSRRQTHVAGGAARRGRVA